MTARSVTSSTLVKRAERVSLEEPRQRRNPSLYNDHEFVTFGTSPASPCHGLQISPNAVMHTSLRGDEYRGEEPQRTIIPRPCCLYCTSRLGVIGLIHLQGRV